MFWRPAHAWRGTRRVWFASPKLMSVVMSPLAATVVYQRFNLLPILATADNDRDWLRW